MKIKTYPLQFLDEKLEEIRECAKKSGKTMKDFMLDAIDKEIENTKK